MAKIKKCLTTATIEKIREMFKDDLEVLEDLKDIRMCTKRKASKYQEFVATCLKGGKNTIGNCAKQWQEQKGK